MPKYDVMVDGQRETRVKSEDDPSAVHLQIIERGTLAWLGGGKLVDRERFL